MTWKRKLELLVEGFLIIALSWAIYRAQGWPRETALFPQVVGAIALFLVCIVFVFDILRMRRASSQDESDIKTEMEADAALTDAGFAIRAGAEFAWLVGYGLAVWLVGFYPATYLYLLAYFIVRAKFTIVGGLILATAVTAVVLLVFYYLLQVTPYSGLLGAWFRE